MPMRPAFASLLVAAMFALPTPSEPGGVRTVAAETLFHAGKLLVASPDMRDPRFKTSVIYMVKHDADGALGLIVNKLYGRGSLANLMKGFGLDADSVEGNVDLHFGGPVKPKAAFVLHTTDYKAKNSESAGGSIAFTTDVEILTAIATGNGPKRYLFALGYAGWSPGQLERELHGKDWTVAVATEDLIFGDALGDVWERLGGAPGLPL